MRTVAGFLIAPTACVAVAYIWTGLQGGGFSLTALDLRFLELPLIVGYVVAGLFGIPAYFILKRINRVSLPTYLVAGFLIGVLTFEITWPGTVKFLIRGLTGGHPIWSGLWSVWDVESACGVAGALSAGVFWFIAQPQKKHAH
jgi:hypothetical protein